MLDSVSSYCVDSIMRDPQGELRVGVSFAADSVADLNKCLAQAALEVVALCVRPARIGFLGTDALLAMAKIALSFDRYALVCPIAVEDQVAAEELTGCLPKAAVLPMPTSDCVMVRTDVLSRFGGFDGACDIPGALVELSLRVNGYGFSTVLCGNAFVDAGTVQMLNLDSFRLAFAEKYPWILREDILAESLWIQPFANLQGGCSKRKPRILFEYSDMMPWYCGTSEMQLAVLDYCYRTCADKYEFYIRCNPEANTFHKLRQRFGNVYFADEEMPLCDIGYVSAQPLTLDQQLFLNSHCLRIVYTMLDCILLRSGYLAEGDPSRADLVRSGLRYADGIVTISDFSRDDYLNLYDADARVTGKLQKTVYLSSNSGNSSKKPEEPLPFDSFVLVAGNYLKHKSLEDVLMRAKVSDRNYVFMGIDAPEGLGASNIRCYRSSFVSDEFLEALYENCDCVVFPSQYEGFGLPITIAWRHGKKVVACRNDLNEELCSYFADMQDNIVLFDYFDQVEGLVDRMTETPFDGSFTTSWDSATVEVEGFIAKVLAQKPNWSQIQERQWHYRTLQQVRDNSRNSVRIKELIDEHYLQGHPGRSALVKAPYRAVRSVVGIVRRRR